jgi:SET family sugar efflux transporter-like MFS transporter
LTARFSVRRLLLTGAACSVTYYTLATLSASSWQLAAGQLLNATSIAAIGGLGVTYVQDMLPRHPGRASTLFTNAFPAGSILAGPILGAAQHLGYRTAYGAAMTLAATGLVVLAISRRTDRRLVPHVMQRAFSSEATAVPVVQPATGTAD